MEYESKDHQWKEMSKGLKLGSGFKLSYRHRAFIVAWMNNNFDTAKAAREVGYKNPAKAGHELATGQRTPQVAKAMAKIQKQFEEKALLKAEDLQRKLPN